MHCEFILVALMMLAETPELQSHLSMEWLNRNGIFAANTGLITRFKRMTPGIAISKRNCPICFKVCSIAASMGILKGATELVLPGYHSTHNEVEIPPFTPAEVANKVVTHMKTEAAQAMVRIMDQHRSLSADAASVGSHPNSDNSDDILPNEPLPYIDNPGVQVDIGVVQWPSSPPKEAILGPTPNLSMPPNYKPGQSPERTRKAGEELEGGAPETSRPRYDDSVEPDASGKASDGKKLDVEMKTD
ncbi:hypothetical protein TI39_contig4100g00028 [Zymoseptoria brevis]|uniref:Uncharacterized protein n=1 Tax=Zymoseptoria brevis TaxID=1047168 RepID=A0A0F4GHG9_9PEZI|nr:hypothetical protein TI39_contig4100g00028 [Zymoseptoria brevis]